jgi:NADH dehydrogenase
MILVAGGTGALGQRVVTRLVREGHSVRVLARHPETSPVAWRGHVELVAGNVRRRRDIDGAMNGVDTVVSAVQGLVAAGGNSPATVDRAGNANLIDAAIAHGADVVLMSIVGAGAHRLELFRAKHAAEEHLRRSHARWTIVRATAYMETWIDIMEQTARGSGRPLVFGRGENAVNFVSAGDVAALVARAVTDASMRGRAVDIGGPENLTFNAFAAAVQRASGRDAAPRHVPRTGLRAMAVAMRVPRPQLARQASLALFMDTADLMFDAAALRSEFPDLPVTTLGQVLAERRTTTASSSAGGDPDPLLQPRDHVTDDSFSLRLVHDLVPQPLVDAEGLVGGAGPIHDMGAARRVDEGVLAALHHQQRHAQ